MKDHGRRTHLDDDALRYLSRRKPTVINNVSWILQEWTVADHSIEHSRFIEGSIAIFLDCLAREQKLTGWPKP